MKYKVIKDVELDKKRDEFVNASAQCMLSLLMNRLCVDEVERQDAEIDESFDIDFDFSMYGDELMKMKQEMGYSSDKFINSAERFVGKL